MTTLQRSDRRRGPELRPFEARLVWLSLLAILLSGAIGWVVGTVTERLIASVIGVSADHTGHRPARPPLPTSPFTPR